MYVNMCVEGVCVSYKMFSSILASVCMYIRMCVNIFKCMRVCECACMYIPPLFYLKGGIAQCVHIKYMHIY